VLRTLFSFRGLILVFGLVAVGLPLALVGQLGIVRTLDAINGDIADTREGQLTAAAVLETQLDEETAVRGYAATRLAVFLEPYARARDAMPANLAKLEGLVAGVGGGDLDDAHRVADMRRLNAEWLRTVAAPILAGAPNQDTLLLRGKSLIDRFRADVRPLDASFLDRYHAALRRRTGAIATTTTVALLSIALIAIEIVVFAAVIVRMRRELDRERGFVETLQSAASVRLVPPPHLAVGTVYRSATRGARIGGDVYDVYRLDADRTLMIVGDVSGKGLIAAVDTTFVRYAVRTLASEGLGPDEIVRRFDALYRAAKPAPESFVTLCAGIHDRRAGVFAYTNAGHEACWVRHGDTVTVLAPTGPVIGLGGIPFGAAQAPLGVGDLLVLATDGLTEARDPDGNMIPMERVTEWIRDLDASSPQGLADALVALVARYSHGRITDDLAILAVRPLS
jgi:CHASE3 domain sensor protein